ncbi:WD40 repeat-like protein [Suillus decipiens]|nr:WD40 repeat-like protein [Suillus decipiens]
MTEEGSNIRITTATQTFKGHEDAVLSFALFPDRRRMVTGSCDMTLCLWNMEDGVVLKKMAGHRKPVGKVAVSRNGQFIVSGDWRGELMAWNRDGESLTRPSQAHSGMIHGLDFSPDSTLLASGAFDGTTKLWNTETWQMQGNPIYCGSAVYCVRYSPSGEHLAIATKDIQIWKLSPPRRCIAKFNFQPQGQFEEAWNFALVWTPDGKQLVSAGDKHDPTIRIWDSLTWKQVGEPWRGHTESIWMIALNPTGTLLASASDDHCVRLWQLSDQRTIAIFQHTDRLYCVTFSTDGEHILSGGADKMISKWAVPLLEDVMKDQPSNILAINTTARNACIIGDLLTADKLFTEGINTDSNDHNSYANRSFVLARKANWDRGLDDALKSMSIQPSLMGCISKGIALCGKRQFQDAMKAFDLGFMFVDANVKKTHLLLLIKAIALFNANEHDEAIVRVQDLATTCPNVDILACQIVEAYLHLQLGLNVLDDTRHSQAAEHFTSAVNTIRFSSLLAIHSKYDIFVVLFGWDLKSLWLTAHQNWCHALLRADRLPEAEYLRLWKIMHSPVAQLTRLIQVSEKRANHGT